MARTTFKLTGANWIHCAGCEQRIANALHRLAGVHAVEASFRTQKVAVELDEALLGTDRVRDRLELLGYDLAPERARE